MESLNNHTKVFQTNDIFITLSFSLNQFLMYVGHILFVGKEEARECWHVELVGITEHIIIYCQCSYMYKNP